MAKLPLVDIVQVTVQDATPPLYYFLLHFWIRLFGSGEVSIRLLSVIPYILTPLIIYFIVKLLTRKSGAGLYIASILTFLNPLLFYFAFEARAYSWLVLLTAFSYLFLLKRVWFFYAVAVLLSLYTHNFFLLVLAAQFITVLLFFSRNEKILFFKTLGLIVFLYLPWVPVVIKQLTIVGSSFWIEEFSLQIFFRELSRFFTGYGGYKVGLFFTLSAVFFYLYLLIAGLLVQKGESKKVFWLSFTWFLFPVLLTALVSLISPLFFSRYLIFSIIPVLILVGYLWSKAAVNYKNNMGNIVLFTLTLIFLILSAHRCFYIFTNPRKKDVRAVILDILPEIKAGSLVVNESALTFFETRYYLGYNGLEQNNCIGKNYKEIPFYVGKALISQKDVCPHYEEAESYIYIKDPGSVGVNFFNYSSD